MIKTSLIFFQYKFTVERLNLVLDLVKRVRNANVDFKTSLYSLLTLLSHYYPDNLNIVEFDMFLQSPAYSGKDRLVYPTRSIYCNRSLGKEYILLVREMI